MKQTEIGLIPDDWEVKSLGEVATIVGGGTPSTLNSAYWNGDIQWFTPAELSDSKKYVSKSERTITERGLKESSAKLLPKGTVLLTTRASIGITAILENPASTNQGFQSLIAKNNCCSEFLYYVIPLIKDEMLSRASGSTFAEISAKKLSTITFQLPPLPEQQRIAKALSDVDALISTTEKLIQKKKNIKQGAMQNLLTGKKRLPGFGPQTKSPTYKQTELGLIPEDWEVKSLGESFDIGSSKRVFQSQWRKSGIPFYRAREIVILAEKNTVENELFIDETLYNQYKTLYGVPAVNDLLVTGVGTLGKVYKVQNTNPFYFKDGNIICLKNKGSINSDYVSYHFDYYIVKDQINDNSGKSTVGTYTINSARKTIIPVPSVPEQTAIANVLSSMDKEIETLNTNLEKYRNLKTAMMQQLLTGKIRLM